MKIEITTGCYENLLELFPDYDYRRLQPGVHPDRRSFGRPDNVVGHQQRAFNIWWAIEACAKRGRIGLELGTGGIFAPWCLGTDLYDADVHPLYVSTNAGCRPQMQLDGSKPLPFASDTFGAVLANHVVEHLPGTDADVVAVLAEWLRVTAPGGVVAVVLPDHAYNDVWKMDPDHKHAWTAAYFRRDIVVPLLTGRSVDVVELDTLGNDFSFNVVLRKHGG